MVTKPRLVIAAPASGHGKTTVATGVLAALCRAGLKATGFKVGPDYIDPSYHALACGRPGRNLDPVLVGEDLIGPLFVHGAQGADVSIVEGVLGLYDGRVGAGDFGSTAHVARLLEAPIVLVVDATGQGRSVAALVHGFRSFGPARTDGVILNRVGSPRHEEVLRDACAEVGVPVLGALRRVAAVEVPSRHLGLVPVAERTAAAREAVAAMEAMVMSGVDIPALLAVAEGAPPLPFAPWAPPSGSPSVRPVIAIAGGAAFSFGYREQVEALAAAGAELAPLDPLRDEKLPEGTKALIVGGGFPEVYGAELSANNSLREQVRALADDGVPVAAECAGLLWLGRALDGYPMCGVLDTEAVMTDRLTLGYRDAVAVSASVLADAGTAVTGHEFHRTAAAPPAGRDAAWGWRGTRKEGFVHKGVHASYLHLHWAAHPDFARRLVAACG
jgi:cobyrinic acid a,c-diamide synthase